jgi:putative molybdopterin biosynthesis protein
MTKRHIINSIDQIKILSDQHRLKILKYLMGQPATISQLGRVFDKHPAWIRHHLKQLELIGLVELVSTRITGGYIEKFYRAVAPAFIFQNIILPDEPESTPLIIMGSHDLALELLAEIIHLDVGNIHLLPVPVGSLDGLIALRNGFTPLTGCHLWDPPTGEYNSPFVRHLFPDRDIVLITLANREQGIILARGNSLGIHSLMDLLRPEINFINRNRGSGTRLWLDHQLRNKGISPDQINGYNQEVVSHTSLAHTIQQGYADAGIGLRAAAVKENLEFIPMFSERYDLIIPRDRIDNPEIVPIIDMVRSQTFRRKITTLAGYEDLHTGESQVLLA